MSLNIVIKTIPHNKQQYSTVGDWQWTLNGLSIFVSDLSDEKKELCVAIHELVEAYLCKTRGISQNSVERFDKQFEQDRQEGNTDEPGDHIKAPYRREHCFAIGIERLLAAELGIEWSIYEQIVNSL